MKKRHKNERDSMASFSKYDHFEFLTIRSDQTEQKVMLHAYGPEITGQFIRIVMTGSVQFLRILMTGSA
jgi:hypothetical protein